MNGQPLNILDEGTLPVLSPDIYHTGQNLAVTLPPTSIGFWVLTGVQAEACVAAPFDSTSEASNNTMYHNIISTKSRQHHNLSHSDQEADSHVTTESREYEFNDAINQYNIFSSKIIEDTRSETDKGDCGCNNTKIIAESDVNVKSKSIRTNRDERERTAQGRYKRYTSDSGKYLIPGLQQEYLQGNNGLTIKNSLGRRNREDRFQKIPRITTHASNIHSLLHEPYHHVRSEDLSEGLSGISLDKLKVNSFTNSDTYIQQGGKSSDKHNNDYDYVDKDENDYEEDENVPSETAYYYGPTHYFEVFHKPGSAANEKFAGYRGELSEAESIALIKPHNQEWEQRFKNDNDYMAIQEQGLTAQGNHKAKSVTTRMPNTYSTETNKQDSSGEVENFEAERRVRGKYKTGIKKDTNNRRNAEKRNHENDYPDLSSLIAQLKKDATTALGALNNKYNKNADAPAEEVEITRSNHTIKETATKDHNKNIPSIAEEYYQEGYRTRRLGKRNFQLTNQRNDRKITKHESNENSDERKNNESLNNTEIYSSPYGNTGLSNKRTSKISHEVTHDNSTEKTSSDTRQNHHKQDSKTSIIQKSFQRTAKDSYEDDESESRASKLSAQHNVKWKVHNQRTDNKPENSENGEYNIINDWYAQINPTKVSEADSEERIVKTYSRKIKHNNQQNIGKSKDANKFRESVSAMKGQNSTVSINPSYIMTPSRGKLSNPYGIESARGGTVTQKLIPMGQQSQEESDVKYKKHSSRKEVTSDESKEMTETDDKQEEAMARKMKANKSRHTNQVTISMPTSKKEARHRMRRDVPSQLPILETSKENRHRWTENATAHEKDRESETISNSTNAELQLESQNIKENNQPHTTHKTAPVAAIIKSYEDLQLDQSTKSSEEIHADHTTQKYSSLIVPKESSGNEYEKYRKLTKEGSANSQQKAGNTLMDMNHHEEYKDAGTNQTYWKLQGDASVEYFMDPEQSRSEGNIKREIGSSLKVEPNTDININDTMIVHTVEGGTQHQHDSVLKTGSTVQEGKWQSAMDISTGETVPPVLMDRNSELEHGTTQKSMMVNNDEGTRDVEKVKNTHRNQDGALIAKMYQENLESTGGVIRLPKATETHINLQHGPGNVTNGGINYNELISNKEKYKHTKNRLKTDEKTGWTGVWNMGIPVKMAEVLPVHKSSILSGKEKTSKLEHKVAKISHGLPSSFTLGKSNKGVTVSETGASMLNKRHHKIRRNQNQTEDTWLHLSEGQYAEEENLRVEDKHGGQRAGWPYEKTMPRHDETGKHRHSKHKTSSEQVEQEIVAHAAKKIFGESAPLETLADNTASKNSSLKNNVKLYMANSDSSDVAPKESFELRVGTETKKFPTINDLRTETLPNVKNINDNMKKAKDTAFKVTRTIMGSKSAEQSSGDGDSDNNGLVNKVNIVTAELNTKNEKEQEYSVFSAEKALKNITDFTDGKFRILSEKKETDVAHSKLQDITTNYISNDKNVADPLVRNAKDIGHLKYIAARKENLHLHGLDNTNYNIKLQLPTIPKTDQMRAHLEKKRLEILHALTAQRAKLEELSKLRVMAAEGKLKLPHHINRRDTTQNKLTESLMSSTETEDSHAPLSIQNEDQTDCSNKDNPSIGSQDFRNTDSDSSSYPQQSNDKYYYQDIHKLLEQMFSPLSTITDVSNMQVPVFGGQQVYKTRHYSESDILPSSYVSDTEDQSLVQHSKNFSSGVVPFSMLHGVSPKTTYAEGLFPGWHTEEKDANKENVSQISSLNSSPNPIFAEDESLGDEDIEIKQLSLPLFLPRNVLLHNPMMVQSKRMPTSENEIRFFIDSETDDADANDRDLTRAESHISSLLLATRSDSPHSSTNLRGTDDAYLKEGRTLENNGNKHTSLMPVTDRNDPNKVLSQVYILSGVDGTKERKGNSKKMDESTYKDRKPGWKHFKSLNKRIVSDKSLPSNGLDEAEPSTLRPSENTKDIKKHNICKTCDKQKNTFIFQPLTQDLGTNSELTLKPDNSNTVPVRSERAISYPFNDNLLQPSTMTNNKNPRIEDNINGKYWLQNVFKNNSKSLGNKSRTEEINSNMYHNGIMTMSNELIISDVAPESNMIIGWEKFKFNSEDTTPADSPYVRNMKLITDYQSKDSENVTDENGLANQTFPGISHNYLNNIINAAEHGEKGNNKTTDALRETSNDVNLQTNEINRQFRILDKFLKSEQKDSTTKADNDGNAVAIKRITYNLHKHVPLAGSSAESPSTVTKLHNRSSPEEERSNAIEEIFSIGLQVFPNVNNKSKGILQSTVSHDATAISEETPRTATEPNDISVVPTGNIMTNINTDILIEPSINKQGNGSPIILQTHLQNDLNNLTGSEKNVTTLKQKAQVSTTKEDPEYSDPVNRNTEHKGTGNGEQGADYTQRDKKPTTGHFHTFIKNISGHIVKFLHNIPPWNY
jgi:hypothetical protein